MGTNADDAQLIAPFWADVDTRTQGNVSYRESTNQDDLMRAQMDIRTAFAGQVDNFRPRLVFIATWYRVGYYNNRVDKVSLKHDTSNVYIVHNRNLKPCLHRTTHWKWIRIRTQTT